MNIKPISTLLTLTLLTAAAAQGSDAPATTIVVPGSTVIRTAPVNLPDTAELRRPVTLTIPAGGMTLDTALTLVARTAGFTVLTQGLPQVQLRTGLQGLSAGRAIETLLNLYAPNSSATLEGKVLIIGDAAAVRRVQGIAPQTMDTSRQTRTVLVPGLTGEQLTRVTSLLTAQSALFDTGVVLLAGTTEQLDASEKTLKGLPKPAAAVVATTPVQVTQTYIVQSDVAQTSAAVRELGTTVSVVGNALIVRGNVKQQADAAALVVALNQSVGTKAAAQQVRSVKQSYDTVAVTEDAQVLAALLPDVKVTPLATQGLLIVDAPQEVQGAVAVILKTQRDRRAGRAISYYTINTGRAADLVSVLKRELPGADVQVVEGRNMLSVQAARADQERVVTLLGQLQAAPTTGNAGSANEIITRSVTLGYSDAQTLATSVSSLAQTVAAAAAATSAATATGAVAAAPAATTTVLANADTNSLLLTGPRTIVEELTRAIAAIDQPAQGVRVRLRVEQVSESDLANLGINWKVGVGGVEVGQSDGNLTVGYAPSLSPASIQVALNTARTKGTGKTIIDSNFLTLSNKDTNFNNGGELLFPATSTIVNGAAVTTPGQTYSYGLGIKVRPRVAPDGTITLTLDTTLGSSPSAGPLASINQTKQSLQNTVMARPGETVVLGGIISTTDDQSRRGVPGLMDIPVLGQLFGSSNKTATRTALLFLLTADPITPPAAQRTGAGAERVNVPATPVTTEGSQRP
ncbi:type II secretion system protein GspD [Deinococcus sp. Leaf326]|uniref:type II secretion system protein GspD n=1 Tax=Deinococcus sp. Leaf326 TaxID=1736338 RepID=UPI0006F6E394|nr:secretin N-terminal domain-containing protein [Deinococcus sp. Leaf326]KQR15510.1 hypothetical protein ASF71_20310 [Deinococcus sp. Leaf326]